jgi:hypothetical protein
MKVLINIYNVFDKHVSQTSKRRITLYTLNPAFKNSIKNRN